nr:hypothetical protein [Tanacetum cinerariifolium]
MVKSDKPPKDKGPGFSSSGGDIDQFDPLYLHSSDTNGVPLIIFKLKDTKNYKVLKAVITIAIHTKNKHRFINGKITRPTEGGFLQEQWDKCNYVVLNWILRCVSQDVFMGHVFSKNAKTIWDELEETYNKQDASYDSLVNLFDCTCDNSEKLKEHNQLLKLMQFLMGLDDVYAPIRSIILTTNRGVTTNPIPDVKGTFTTFFKDESHMGSHNHSVTKTRNSAFVARPNNNKNNNWTNNNKQAIKLNILNLVCTHCNMNGHTADRCFELVEYPPNFKKNTRFNKNSSSNSANAGNKDHSPKNSFTDDQYKRLMALISVKSGSSSILANIAVGHPNGTKAVVTHVGSLRLTEKIVIHDVLVVLGYLVSLLSVHKLSKDNMLRVIFDEGVCVIQDFVLKTQVGTGYSNEKKGYKLFSLETKSVFFSRDVNFYETVFLLKNSSECKEYELIFQNKNSLNFFNNNKDESMSNEPNNDGRDMNNKRSKDTNNTPLGGTKNTKCTKKDEGLLNDSTLEEVASGVDESVILNEKVNESEGDDNQYQEFKNVFQGDIPDSQEVSLRRSTRKTSIPKKFSDFELGSKVKYSIDKQVNYSNLSSENYNFAIRLN